MTSDSHPRWPWLSEGRWDVRTLHKLSILVRLQRTTWRKHCLPETAIRPLLQLADFRYSAILVLTASIVIVVIDQRYPISLKRSSRVPSQRIMGATNIVEEVLRSLLEIVLTNASPAITRLPKEESANRVRDPIEKLTVGMIHGYDQ